MTQYVILRRTEREDGAETSEWREDEKITASSPRRALAAAEVRSGTYVAIPARSWKPLTVNVKQITKTTIT